MPRDNPDSTIRLFSGFARGSVRLIVHGNRPYYLWLALLGILIVSGAAAYINQVRTGLAVTAMRDQVSWGFYIGNFTFLVGVAAAAVVLVIPAYIYDWKPIREMVIFGELLAISAISMCLLFVLVDLGRPDRFWHLIPPFGYLNFPSSLLAWDVVVLNVYFVINFVVATHILYRAFHGKPYRKQLVVPLVLLSIPMAVGIHTVTAFLYNGLAARPYWNSSILAPQFLASAFCSGPAILLVVLQLLRRFTRFEIQDEAIWKIAELMAYAMFLNLFLHGAEAFKEYYSDTQHLLYTRYWYSGLGEHRTLVPYAWSALSLNLAAFFLFISPAGRRNPVTLNLGCLAVYAGVYIEKGMGLIIPGLTPDALGEIYEYYPTITELRIAAGIFALGFLLFTLMLKVAVPISLGEFMGRKGSPPPRDSGDCRINPGQYPQFLFPARSTARCPWCATTRRAGSASVRVQYNGNVPLRMIDAILAKVFGTQNEREIKRIRPLVAAINELEPRLTKLSDAELAAHTPAFRERLEQGAPLDDLLVEAFAVVREAGRRALDMRHFDVQLIGGIVLHRGKIAEMKTGEGKTLVATLPVYLNALSSKGVHVVTVNDYLAKRDAEWMGRIYKFLGMSVGTIVHDLDDRERYAAYHSDITYGTNNEFGFDYLRDNMKFRLEDCAQREHHFAIVDEVDSILVDEARTPLIISGPSEESTDKYYKANRIIPKLIRGEVIEGKEPGEKYLTGDYTVDEKHRSVGLTEEGVLKCEKLLGVGNLYEPVNMEWNHHVQQGLRAHVLYHLDKDYVINDGQVIIVDEFTGRLMPGRRWSDGLHQAVEAKENVKIERENQTLATITFQNYFRLYKKLAGMTGTAETEAAEFQKIYNLDVVVIPTNRDLIRLENPDIVYRTEEEKFRNAAKEIKERNDKGQPVLVGTISVEKSEKLSGILKRMGVRHEVLNAKHHDREASIVAQAGRKAAVTVSTNMAGRGTDIVLGGNAEFMAKEQCLRQKLVETLPEGQETFLSDHEFYHFHHLGQFYRVPRPRWDELFLEAKSHTDVEHEEVVALGGLHIVGTERHESRRIDNQLRGRAGRQGDPGSSRFFLSLQDDLLRIFGGERLQNLMLRLGMEEDVPIESRLISRRIEKAQKAVEGQNFAARKHILEYDDVMNKQRQYVYRVRRRLLEGEDQKDHVIDMVRGIVGSAVPIRCPDGAHPSTWQLAALQSDILTAFGHKINIAELAELSRDEIEDTISEQLAARYQEKAALVGLEVMRETERMIMLHVIDGQWKDHLLSMDHLKEGIGLRGYGQKDPLVEYKKESYVIFQEMMDRIEDETIRFLFFLQPVQDGRPMLPFSEEDEYEETAEDRDAAAFAAPSPNLAQSSIQDFTRNIQRKKEKELAELQFVGGEASSPQGPVVKPKKVGRNETCPCGSGKKYKKCCGSAD